MRGREFAVGRFVRLAVLVLASLILDALTARAAPSADFGQRTALEVSDVVVDEGASPATFVNGSVSICGAWGDVSRNGTIGAWDAALILLHTVHVLILDTEQQELADVSDDGNLSAYDASLILRWVVGLIDRFPVEENSPAP